MALALGTSERPNDDDLRRFHDGSHDRLYEWLGAHLVPGGVRFTVWAPNARRVSVVGNFNGWDGTTHPLKPIGEGLWSAELAGVETGDVYRYFIETGRNGRRMEKADPFGFGSETPPRTGSTVESLDYTWHDEDWLRHRARRQSLTAPISVYEVHLGSWRRPVKADGTLGWYNYRELAPMLAEYALGMGFTHVEFLPIAEHPFYGSWGYQVVGYFCPTRRYGSPRDFMYLVDYLHQRGLGVVVDWVPSHFPADAHGLGNFDGTSLYESTDPKKQTHPDWKTLIFDFTRPETRSFLLSNARFWLEKFHVDALRVDAVASMLYLDYSRKPGEWSPNRYGGNENLEAVTFLRRLNEEMYQQFPGVQTIAEESTTWPLVSRPTSSGGLGFGMKWDMGWMHDTLQYLSHDPLFRKHHHQQLTFRGMYAEKENYMLALSHDEVVHEKGSLYGKMPGTAADKLANLRLLFGYMYSLPGKKLLFMGDEFGQRKEWSHDAELEWVALKTPGHWGLQRWVRDLNTAYRAYPALHALDCSPAGFRWIDPDDVNGGSLSYLRMGPLPQQTVAVACNFTPVVRHNVRIGAPCLGRWTEILNSDATLYGGGGHGNLGGVDASPVPSHGYPCSLTITLPPLSMVAFHAPAAL